MNKVVLCGNLGADPEVRFTPSGQPVCTFSLATNEYFRDKKGEQQQRTEWHRVVTWGRLAELCGEYLTKGRQVLLEGQIRTRSWTDREGQKRWTTEIRAFTVNFLGAAQRERQQAKTQEKAQATKPTNGNGGHETPAPPSDEDAPSSGDQASADAEVPF